MGKLFQELKRRKVFRVAAVYALKVSKQVNFRVEAEWLAVSLGTCDEDNFSRESSTHSFDLVSRIYTEFYRIVKKCQLILQLGARLFLTY